MILTNLAFYIHLSSLAVAVCGVIYADKIGFSWMRGKTEIVSHRTLEIVHAVMSYSLSLLMLTGLYMFWPLRSYLLHQPLFILKMIFVSALVINSVAINKLKDVAGHQAFRELSPQKKLTLTMSGAISFICWVGAALSALLLFGVNIFGFYWPGI